MGSPAFPSPQQQADLRRAAELASPLTDKPANRQLSLSRQPNALAVIEFARRAEANNGTTHQIRNQPASPAFPLTLTCQGVIALCTPLL